MSLTIYSVLSPSRVLSISAPRRKEGRKVQLAAQNCILKSYICAVFAEHYEDDEIKDEMGETCSMHAKHERCTQYWYGN
jgi:hypothetical protein